MFLNSFKAFLKLELDHLHFHNPILDTRISVHPLVRNAQTTPPEF